MLNGITCMLSSSIGFLIKLQNNFGKEGIKW